MDAGELIDGLARVCARAGLPEPRDPVRLTGGATMESWRFTCGDDGYVLRRAPSMAFMADRPFGHDVEAAIIRAAHDKGVSAPEIVAGLEPGDGIGSGFVMRALTGSADPRTILEGPDPERLLSECAAQLARIHSLGSGDVPDAVPVMDYRAAIADLKAQFEDAGGDRAIIALGLKWMEDNCPDPVEPVLIHGDYRMGNLLVDSDGWLTGVLDWELAHLGDWHEDLAFGCMAVWRFHRYDRPALGLGAIEAYLDTYEANGGRPVDRDRFRYWLIHRTVWWALGCLRMAKIWRSGEDRMLERVVISRRTSEQELDLLMLLEEAEGIDMRSELILPSWNEDAVIDGEATDGEIVQAVSEWLTTLKEHMKGHDRFQLAVARNALGLVARDLHAPNHLHDQETANAILSGDLDHLSDWRRLQLLRHGAIEKCRVDSPKYPALERARAKWMRTD